MALTWRNVDGPDFRSSMDGYRSAANLFSDAFGGLSRGLDTFDASISRAANNRLLMDFAGIQDADTAKARLRGLATDPNAARYNAQTIDAVTGRPAALTEQAGREADLSFNNWRRDREKTVTGAKDNFAQFLPGFEAAASRGEGSTYLNTHAADMKGLDFATVADLVGGVQNYRKGQLGILGAELNNEGTAIGNAGARLQNARGQFEFDQTKLNVSELRQAQELIAAGRERGATAEDMEGYINGLSGVSGVVKNAVRQGLGGGLGIGASPSGSGGGGGGTSALSTTYGGGSLSPNIQTVGDFVANKGAMLKDLGATPVGLYQINAGTWEEFAPKALGANWKNASVRDFATQDAVAKSIFESLGGSGQKLMGRWASIKDPAQAAAIAKMPWEQAREYIAKGETGASAAAVALAGSAAAQEVGFVAARTAANNPLAIDFAKTSQDNRDVTALADELRGSTFKGTDRGALVGRIRQIMDKGKVNAATAAAILTNNVTQSDQDSLRGMVRRVTLGSANLGGGLRINDEGVANDLAQVRNNPRSLVDSSISRQADAARVGMIQQSQAGLAQAQAAFDARAARKQVQPGLSMEKVTADLVKARAAARAASMAGSSRYSEFAADPNNGIDAPPAPPPVVMSRPAKPTNGTPIRQVTNYNGPMSANGWNREDAWRRAMSAR